MWNDITYTMGETKVSLQWKLEPANKITRVLWRFFSCYVTINYISLIQDREKKEGRECGT